MLVVDWSDGDRDYRITVDRGTVGETESSQLQKASPADLPVTFEALGSGSSSQPWKLITNDPVFDQN